MKRVLLDDDVISVLKSLKYLTKKRGTCDNLSFNNILRELFFFKHTTCTCTGLKTRKKLNKEIGDEYKNSMERAIAVLRCHGWHVFSQE